ncbi:MAG TPA: hypothetical protein VK186_00125 [Candidatus Deferrimicrobium sp.]|nr:hypothetical protein [Candidatus Kapabacteria bacterium]HLP57196.1 hypothetical protein [Candidatus Deferrimicrobium sp.]
MEPFELLIIISNVFEELKIPYFITGSIASITYGEPRFTNDIDMVADIRDWDIPGLVRSFPSDEYYIDADSIDQAIRLKSQFNIIHLSSGLKIDVMVKKKTVFDHSRFSRIKRLRLEEKEVNFASPEDVILKKMEYYKMGSSEKHLRDITGILKIYKGEIDFEYLKNWISRFDLFEIWEAIEERLEGKLLA